MSAAPELGITRCCCYLHRAMIMIMMMMMTMIMMMMALSNTCMSTMYRL